MYTVRRKRTFLFGENRHFQTGVDTRFTLTAYEAGYPVTFIVMFLTAYITGTFALSCKRQAEESAKTARRTQILFDTDQMLTKAKSRREIIHAAAGQAIKLLDRNIVVFEAEDEQMIHPYLFPQSGVDRSDYDAEKELSAARWALALENEKNTREKEAAAVLAESEQLRANLLRTISRAPKRLCKRE